MIGRILFWLAIGFAVLVIPPAIGLIGPVEFVLIMLALVAVVVFAVRDIRKHSTRTT